MTPVITPVMTERWCYTMYKQVSTINDGVGSLLNTLMYNVTPLIEKMRSPIYTLSNHTRHIQDVPMVASLA